MNGITSTHNPLITPSPVPRREVSAVSARLTPELVHAAPTKLRGLCRRMLELFAAYPQVRGAHSVRS